MDPIKKSTDPNAAKGMFSVVERMNAGYEKFFESKPKTSAVRSECYSNFMTCGSKSKNAPNLPAEIKTEEKTPENQPDVVQQFFPRDDETEQHEEKKKQDQVVVGSSCCKFIVKKEK